MSLTLEQVRHVANLARLSLTPEEERRYQEQLSAILEAMKALEGLDTSQVEPTSHATLAETLLRPDEVRPSIGVEKALANAPAKVGSYFAVPTPLPTGEGKGESP
ncbi:MAG: Asp-tRNA(Asn)/Glu-tRNA(Gln) amidotransferase subunit GatC [Myxococcota bacterium]